MTVDEIRMIGYAVIAVVWIALAINLYRNDD